MASILIIEDEISIAELERDYLELSGFEVEIETSGTSGLERALKEDFNLIILDLMLPGIDGFDICKKIRENKNTPIIMVSAKKDDIDKIRGLGLGADDYMTKPFSPSELVARVKAHMARYQRVVGSNAQQNDIAPEKLEVIEGNIIDDKAVQDRCGYECYDVVCANILADVLEPLSAEITQHMKPGAYFITSGIIDTKEQEVAECFKKNPELEIVEINHDGEWVNITARKRGI